jgi:hypothetical protein
MALDTVLLDKDDGDTVSVTSTDILASTPFFFQLQKCLYTDQGTSIAEELANLNRTMASIAHSLSVIASKPKKVSSSPEDYTPANE